MKKTQHKIPASLMQTRISQKVQEELHKLQDKNQDDFRRGYETARRDILATQKVEPKLSDEQIKKIKLDNRPPEILGGPKLQYSQGEPQPVLDKQMINMKTRWIVQNWHKGWLWLSNWIFILIAWVAYNGIPPELLTLIPEANRENVIPILSALGVICRFIDQSRKKPLPPVQAVQEDA